MDGTCIVLWAAVGKLMRREEKPPQFAARWLQLLLRGRPCPEYVPGQGDLSVCVKKERIPVSGLLI